MHDIPQPQHKKMPLACKIIYLLTALSALLYVAFMLSPAFSDWFNQSIGQFLRFIFAKITTWIPFSLAEMLLLLIPLWVYLLIYIGNKHYCDTTRSMLTYIGIIGSILCVVIISFVWTFAAGHYGTKLDEKLGLERKQSSAEELYETALLLSKEIGSYSEEVVFLESGKSLMPYSYDEMSEKLLAAYDSFCQKHDFIDTFSSSPKTVMLSEPMSYTHITGVYTFFTGEANINVNFPDYTIPYTTAHEMAHQRGVAREDEANFIAFLICMESDDPYIRYSGALNLYEYVVSSLSSVDFDRYRLVYYTLPAEVRAEEEAYARFFEQYRDSVAADISQTANDLYLQSQGSSEGTKSYGLVVDLAVAYYRSALE